MVFVKLQEVVSKPLLLTVSIPEILFDRASIQQGQDRSGGVFSDIRQGIHR